MSGTLCIAAMLLVCCGSVAVAQEIPAGKSRARGTLAESKAGDSTVPAPPSRAADPAIIEAPEAEKNHPYQLQPGEDPQNELGFPLLKHFAGDQKDFWTAPVRLHASDLRWIAPAAGLTAALLASDSWIARQVPDKPNQLLRSQHISNYAVYSLMGVDGGSFLLGHITGNDHLAETGLLGGEAGLNSTAVAYLLNYATQRPRPIDGNGHGSFFQGGASFPSEHSTLAWSMASVIAHEYPGPLTKFAAYGLASAVTLTRITSKQHFASDAVVGSALGWYFGRQAYRAHHDPELGGGSWGDLPLTGETPRPRRENMGSPYVPLDSWVYPAFERLAALGYVQSAYLGQRPWSRLECAGFLEEAGEHMRYDGEADDGAGKIYFALQSEFQDETRRLDGASNVGTSIDSVYTRTTAISGTPLTDGYHFAQTLTDDYGRPYGAGFNQIAGVTAHAVAGPLSIAIQGEYQHAPALGSDPANVLQAIATADSTPAMSNGRPEINRFQLLDSTVALTVHGFEFSFGKQSLWLGPSSGDPFLFGDNADPVTMFRVDQTSPIHIPGLSRLLGPMRSEFFLGRLSGARWVYAQGTLYGPNIGDQPFLQGSKISFKPTPNLEFGMGITAIFGGPGMPVTWHNFLRTFSKGNGFPGTSSDPGDRRSTFDFSYRVPYVRDYLTIYADSFVEDEVSPLGSTRPAMQLGMYFPKLPRLPKLELRMEGVYTDVPGFYQSPEYIYWNLRYRSGYTNDGNMLGSWIGRDGRGGQASATYWFSPRSFVQAQFRHQIVDKAFLEGGRRNDFGVRSEFLLGRDLSLAGQVQYEPWDFPLLAPAGKANLTTSVQLTFYPRRHMERETEAATQSSDPAQAADGRVRR
jgi:Capsule assembly protein Wzi/PAP2 superfamily